jgi:hypothetical protein
MWPVNYSIWWRRAFELANISYQERSRFLFPRHVLERIPLRTT